jgi:predicted AAA+ superfamily ATPase
MLKSVAESMAGRVAVIDLGPMILEELNETFTKNQEGKAPHHWLEHYLKNPTNLLENCAQPAPNTFLLDTLFRGGYPGLIGMDDSMLPLYFDGYLKTYIDRDVRTMTDIDQLIKFESFVTILAALTSQEINYAELGREIDSAGKTAQRWLSILHATYMWRDVEAFSLNSIKKVSQRRKGYFVDTGFACQLLKIQSPEQLRGHPQCGALFETYISNTIYSVLKSLLFGVGIYHWRSVGGAEVDIVLHYGNALYPIEVKMKSNVGSYEARGIKAFKETYKDSSFTVMPGIIVCASTTAYWLNESVMVLPWNMLCKN